VGRLKRLLPYLKRHRTALFWSIGAATAASVLDGFSFALLIPFLRVLFGEPPLPSSNSTVLERILDGTVGNLLGGSDPARVLVVAVSLIFLSTLLKNVFSYIGSLISARVEEGLARDLRTKLYSHLLGMHLGYLEKQRAGQLLTRMLADAEQAKHVVVQALASLLQNSVLIAVYLVLLFSLSWQLTVSLFVLVPLLVAVMGPIVRRIRRNFRRALDDRGELTAVMSETLQGMRVVKAFGGEEYEEERFFGAATRYYRGILKTQKFAIMASPLSETLGAGVVLMLSAWMASSGALLRPELFMAFLAVTIRLLPPVRSLAQFPARIEVCLSASDRIFEVLDVPSRDTDKPGGADFPGIADAITFKNVSFGYLPDVEVLHDISLRIPRGKVIGIVGPSGAGKSTLVDLIPRFIEPISGEILFDGKRSTTFTRDSLRGDIGIVSQETVIFNDTVTTNIAYGETTPDLERVREAARAANAHHFIEKLPDGYGNLLGERGTRLSGGERQRLALARAIYRDPPILILDEATSSLDTESERLVQEAIERLFLNRTVVVIAHRLSTVASADAIVVLDRGRVVEHGTHAELVTAGGLYQQLYATGAAGGVI
jgi:ATP-binding cassette, subfamily B, bacterial MsbA